MVGNDNVLSFGHTEAATWRHETHACRGGPGGGQVGGGCVRSALQMAKWIKARIYFSFLPDWNSPVAFSFPVWWASFISRRVWDTGRKPVTEAWRGWKKLRRGMELSFQIHLHRASSGVSETMRNNWDPFSRPTDGVMWPAVVKHPRPIPLWSLQGTIRSNSGNIFLDNRWRYVPRCCESPRPIPAWSFIAPKGPVTAPWRPVHAAAANTFPGGTTGVRMARGWKGRGGQGVAASERRAAVRRRTGTWAH